MTLILAFIYLFITSTLIYFFNTLNLTNLFDFVRHRKIGVSFTLKKRIRLPNLRLYYFTNYVLNLINNFLQNKIKIHRFFLVLD